MINKPMRVTDEERSLLNVLRALKIDAGLLQKQILSGTIGQPADSEGGK